MKELQEIQKKQYILRPVRTRANKLLDEIIRNIAKEENLSIEHINIVLQSVFSLIRDSIKDSNINEMRIMNFGTFKMKPKQKEKFIKKYNLLK